MHEEPHEGMAASFEFAECLRRLNWTQQQAAKDLDVNERTLRRWCDPGLDGNQPPGAVLQLVRFMVGAGYSPEWFRENVARYHRP